MTQHAFNIVAGTIFWVGLALAGFLAYTVFKGFESK